MSIFGIQKILISTLNTYLKSDAALTSYNFYANEIVFLQDYELPAILLYSFKNVPTQSKERDSINSHERILELRFELRSATSAPVDYESLADTLYSKVLDFKKLNKYIAYVGNPSFQIGLDEKAPTEIAATLDISLYYQGKP